MSFFDQPYYALTKTHMSRIGIWPEQSRCVRIVRPLTMLAIIMTLVIPGLIRMHDAKQDINTVINSTVYLLIGIAIVSTMFSGVRQIEDIKLALKHMEEHWEMVKNTSAVIVLDKYADRGRYIIVIYSTIVCIALALHFSLCLSRVILDVVVPLNESRPKIYIVEVEYGVDADKYYWFILSHTYIVLSIALYITVAVESMYIVWVIHACALFEVVGFNLKLSGNEFAPDKKNEISLRRDWCYKNICDCVAVHVRAISFSDLLESGCSGISGVVIGINAIITAITGIQANQNSSLLEYTSAAKKQKVLINWRNPDVLVQQVTFIIGQVCTLYINSIPGQELINHSQRIHTIAYSLKWQDMSVKAQKLLIPILMRSYKPCCLTAGKFYVLSLKTFSAAMRTVISYFTVFAKLLI